MIYNVVFILLLYLSYYYDFHGNKTGQHMWHYFYDTKRHKNGRNMWYYSILVFFIVFAGLRWRLGMDTPNYIYHFYHDIPIISGLTKEDLNLGSKPLWIIINSVVKTLNGRYYIVQLIEAAFVNILILNYFKKHSQYLFTCIFFYYILLYFSMSFAVMKAAMSIVVCLYANDFILQKKWVKGMVLYLIAVLFHPQAILIMLTPFLLFLKLKKRSILLFVVLYVSGFYVQSYLGESLELFDFDEDIYDKVESVATSDRYSSRTSNFNYAIVNILPYFFYAVFSLYALKRHKPNTTTLRYEPFVMLCLCFIVLEMNVYIAYRFAMYFFIFFIMMLSETFVEFAGFGRKSRNKSQMFVKSFLIILPFLILFGYRSYQRAWVHTPYSSVIEREIDQTREWNRLELHPNGPRANVNEY